MGGNTKHMPTDDEIRWNLIANINGDCNSLANAVLAKPELYQSYTELLVEASSHLIEAIRKLDSLEFQNTKYYKLNEAGYLVRVK